MVRASRHRLDGSDGEAVAELAGKIRELPQLPEHVHEQVEEIMGAIWERGDSALIEFTRRLDGVTLSAGQLRVSEGELEQALASLDAELAGALDVAIENVRRVADSELDGGGSIELGPGHRVTAKSVPVRRAAAYVPGGTAAYPSTVIMCATPARVAGVEEIVISTPPGEDGRIDPVVLAACAMSDVREIYRMGGAQAIAALGYGTETVSPVDLIVGPGNVYVQEAKRRLVGTVGIDGIAGPSELMVIADAHCDVTSAALDLAAQAEHGPHSLLVFATDDEGLLDRIDEEVRGLAAENPTVTPAPLALVQVDSLAAACSLANAIAPEHLELVSPEADSLVGRIRAAGCVFVGPHTAVAFGDYAAGSNHVLPTGGAARFAGPLSPNSFRHRMSLVELTSEAAAALAPVVERLARAEGYPVHAKSAEARR